MGLLLENNLHDIIAITTAFVAIVIAYLKWTYTYWERKGLKTPSEATLFFGNTKDMMLGKKTFGETFLEAYQYFRSKGLKHAGVYMGWQKIYLPIDPEIIKSIMIKDFPHFMNHGGYTDEENDPLTGNLFNLENAKWKHMRVKLSPTFTSGKMKMMFHTMADCTKGLKELLEKEQNPVDIKEVLGRFTTDVIGSCAFGIECNSLKDPDSEFRKYGKRIFENTFFENLKTILQFSLPKSFLRLIKFRVSKPEVEKFIMNIVEDTVNYREKNNIYRKDFLHLLLQLKNRGKVEDDDKIKNDNGGTGEEALTMKELAAQVFVFFAAGFETSSTTMTFALLELSQDQNIQDKLREEINTVLAKHNGEMTYEAVMEMTFMDKVLNETLRKYPPVPVLGRECTKDYTVPGTDVVIEKGTNVMLPIWGLHTDPEYYPNPDKFDPERFTEEEKSKRPAIAWIPFGEGPRLCIGLRFGLLQAKVGLTVLLKNFKLTLNRKTKVPVEMEKTSFVSSVQGGVWLDVQPIK